MHEDVGWAGNGPFSRGMPARNEPFPALQAHVCLGVFPPTAETRDGRSVFPDRLEW